MAEVVWTEPALSDLDAVADYIALDAPEAAKALVGRVFEHVEQQQRFPASGSRPPELTGDRYRQIAAMISSFLVAVGFFVARKNGAQIADHVSLIVTVATTTVVWVSVTFLGPETSRETLVKFFRLVRRPARGGLT